MILELSEIIIAIIRRILSNSITFNNVSNFAKQPYIKHYKQHNKFLQSNSNVDNIISEKNNVYTLSFEKKIKKYRRVNIRHE